MAAQIDTARLFKDDKFTDVEMRIEGQSYGRAHKLVLYNRSSRFREILDQDVHAQQIDMDFLKLAPLKFRPWVARGLLEAIYTGKLESFSKQKPRIYCLMRQLVFHNVGHHEKFSLLQQAAANCFKQIFDDIDLDNQNFPKQYDALISQIYGKEDKRPILPPEIDEHGIRDFFRDYHLPSACKYLDRQKTEKLLEESSAFADDFHGCFGSDLSALVWREDHNEKENEENDSSKKREQTNGMGDENVNMENEENEKKESEEKKKRESEENDNSEREQDDRDAKRPRLQRLMSGEVGPRNTTLSGRAQRNMIGEGAMQQG
ncbi:hypothetical protein IWX90DRAFT_489684 [Phyllosticta citrichinensis]|uniref:BTB domain-containing protein n=1 Tax=Phyllosticta citrichinensis TaxID=1130410 RepID=A0ABR1XHY2_9PEZI